MVDDQPFDLLELARSVGLPPEDDHRGKPEDRRPARRLHVDMRRLVLTGVEVEPGPSP